VGPAAGCGWSAALRAPVQEGRDRGEDPRPHVRRVLTAPLDGVTLRLVDASGALVAEWPLTQPVR